MARCTVKIMMELSSILVATHDRPHYVFTQHDLYKVAARATTARTGSGVGPHRGGKGSKGRN